MWRLVAGNLSLAEASRLVHQVVDAGITLLDTADIYGFTGSGGFGDAETLLGAVLADNPGVRNRIVLSTKGGIRPPIPYDQSPEYLARAIDDSLRRLRVDTIDLWHIHRPDILAHPQEVARTLDDAVRKGKIRTLGVSNFTMHQIVALQHFLRNRLVATQPEISPLRIDCFENGELDQAMVFGLTPLAWSPIAGGRLSDPQSDRDRDVASALDKVAEEAGVSRSVAAYSWLMAHPAGIIPIVGSLRPDRIVGALDALRVQWTRQSWYAVLVAARGRKLP
jgi:predicted oxidoreductase